MLLHALAVASFSLASVCVCLCLRGLPINDDDYDGGGDGNNIYIFIHQNMIERTEQKVQQKSTHKKRKKTTIEQVTQIYI